MPRPLLFVTALILLTLSACGATPATSPAPSSRTTEPSSALIKTGSGPVGLAADSRGRIWVANANEGTVSRLNANGNRVDLTAHVGDAPLRLAATGGAIWVSVFSAGTLRELDEVTGRVRETVRVGAEPEGVAVAFGSVWVVLQASAELLRVDPGSGQLLSRYAVGSGPRLVTAGAGSLWVSDFQSDRVLRVNPRTGEVRRSAQLCDGPQGMLSTAKTLWVTCTPGDTLVGLDPISLKQTSRLTLKGSPDAIVAEPSGALVVSLQKGPALVVIDPDTSKVSRRVALGKSDQLYDRANIDVIYARGGAWVSSYLQDGIFHTPL